MTKFFRFPKTPRFLEQPGRICQINLSVPTHNRRTKLQSFISKFLILNFIFVLGLWRPGLPADANGFFAGQDNETSASTNDKEIVPGSKLLSPKGFGFEIPVARPVPTTWKNVMTLDQSGREIVAKVHVKLGENFIVLLPNGQLVARRAADVTNTDKKFRAASADEIADEIMQGPLANFKLTKTKQHIFIHNTTKLFAEATKKILVSMLNSSELRKQFKRMDINTHDPEIPLVVIMFNTEAQFQAYSEGQRVPHGAVAYYNMVNNHIVLHEESRLFASSPELARGQLLSTIAHEGAHQILHNIGVQQRLSMWPMWLTEGVAEYYAPTSFGRKNKWKGAGVVNDLRMFELETFLQTKQVAGFDGSTIEKAVLARQLDSTGYATAWSITHYLAKNHKKEFGAYLKLMSQLGPMRGMASRSDLIPENLEHFQSFFGMNIEKVEREMIDYLARQKYTSPVAHQIHYVALVQYSIGNQIQQRACFFNTENKVMTWKTTVEQILANQGASNVKWSFSKFPNRAAASQFIKRNLKSR